MNIPTDKKDISIYPLMPTRYSPAKRKELRKFEKKLLNGKRVKV